METNPLDPRLRDALALILDLLGANAQGAAPAPALTLGAGIDFVRAEMTLDRRRDGTRRCFDCQVRQIVRFWPLDTPLPALGKPEIEGFIAQRLREGVSGETVRKQLSALGRVFRLAIRNGHIRENPLSRVRRPSAEHYVPDVLAREEVETALARLREDGARRDADLALLLFTTGIRRSELARVRVRDINLAGRELHVRIGKRRPRALPIPDGLAALLERVLAWGDGCAGTRDRHGRFLDANRTWAGEGGERYLLPGLTEQGRAHYISRAFARRIQRMAGDLRLHAHALRHSFCSHLARSGFGEHVIAALAGHDLGARSITARYVHVHGPQAREAMEAFWC